jgi:phage gp29-like protein
MTWTDWLFGRTPEKVASSSPPPWAKRRRAPARLEMVLPDREIPDAPDPYFASGNMEDFDLRSDHMAGDPAMGLTVARLFAIFRTAEQGYVIPQCDLFEGLIERDGHLRSQIENRVDAVAGKPWMIQPGGPRIADGKAAAVLTAACQRIDSFRLMLEHQLLANAYGWSATEIIWDEVDGWIVPVHFANTAHRRFRFLPTTDELLIYTAASRGVGEPLLPGKWIVTRRKGRVTARAGLMRTAALWTTFKRMSVLDWVKLAARFGLPYVTGTWREGASKEDKAIVKLAVQSMGRDGWAAFNEACQLAIHEVKAGGSDSVYGAIVNICDREISKLFSGGTLNSDNGGAGSYNLGSIHRDRAWDLNRNDAERLAQRFEQAVGAPFVKFNGMPATAPRLKIHMVREDDPVTRAKVYSTVANDLGLPVSASQVREDFQLREPSGPDDELTGQIPATGDPSKGLPPSDDSNPD